MVHGHVYPLTHPYTGLETTSLYHKPFELENILKFMLLVTKFQEKSEK